jgi:hypothetical protein
MVIGSASAAYAATGFDDDGAGILTYFFVGFFALIVVSQLVPAVILFIGMLKGVFTRNAKSSTKTSR